MFLLAFPAPFPAKAASQKPTHSSGGKSHPSAKEPKKSPPHVRTSSNRPAKNLPAVSEKVTENRQINVHWKEKSRFCEDHQQNRIASVCTSSSRASRLKKEPLVRKQDEVGPSKISAPFKDVSWSESSRAEGALSQSFPCEQKRSSESHSGGQLAEASSCSLMYQGASADAMFLDFKSMQILKEDSDEDSASDLSDSERIPIPPSPCTPPKLDLRAEEIDPLSFEHLFDEKFKQSDYYYPDFLPPPFNTWDLKGLAAFVNTECRSEPRPEPVGFLERYVDRLLELEWLQMQTIQAEKGKAAKARPQTAPSALRTLKSPGKSKSLHSPLPSKQLTPHESFARLSTGHAGPRRDLRGERASQFLPYEGPPKAAEASCSSSSAHEGHSCEGRREAKKRTAPRQQLGGRHHSESSAMIQGAGNMRPHKPPSSFHSSAVPLKGLPAHACTNPKKNGNANTYVSSKKAAADKKLKVNDVKQTPRKFK
ncbi:protein FAM217B isoform X2 [Varanus komodoensis]|uniref:protein FAM217B isoform X2 n=1 Tax=Varanus komodoensis TaxID=61221 RepID=UPI001CF76E69|nr:protein FAM217B isoform X2 [Varanus komodoensis]XP_044311429.1 protein FAM217B isoform X2 [Varanus komodoensis]XP_044311430.1 protein FAM217B isoform X2 [Varanus komodoensis]